MQARIGLGAHQMGQALQGAGEAFQETVEGFSHGSPVYASRIAGGGSLPHQRLFYIPIRRPMKREPHNPVRHPVE
jgi:hypothetical protein